MLVRFEDVAFVRVVLREWRDVRTAA